MDPEMLKVMERFSDFNVGQQNPRSLTSMKMHSKKRKRADVERDFEVNAMINSPIARREVCSGIFG